MSPVALLAEVVGAAAGSGALGLHLLMWWERGTVGPAVSDYIAPQYWLTYGDGFSRRALPGQVLAWVSDGATSYQAMRVAALALSLAGLLSTLLVAALLALRATGPRPRRWLTLGLAAGSPLTAVLFVRDVGRYDSVAAIALAALAVLAVAAVPQTVARALAAALVLVATASQEFLFLLLAPAAIAVVLRDGVSWRRRLSPVIAVLLPGALMAAASLLLRPTPTQIAAARERARAAGAPLSEYGDTATALGHTLREQLEYFAEPTAGELLLTVGVWSGLFAVSVVVLWSVLGRPDGYWSLVGYFALLAALLSATNVDMRRWWSLALLGLLACLAARPPRPRDDAWGGLPAVGSVLLLFVAFLVTRSLPVNVLDADTLRSLL